LPGSPPKGADRLLSISRLADGYAGRESAYSGQSVDVIVASGLTKSYGDKVVVNDLSFEVNSGTFTGFIGPNGAGKSTTMRMLIGLDRPDSGTATISGLAYPDLKDPMREVGVLIEAKAFHATRTARNHLRMMAAAGDIKRTRIDEVLDMVGLSSEADRSPSGYSLGMAQRFGLALALLGDPGILILDEPTNGLDPEGIAWMRGLLRTLADDGRSVFVSSHLLSELAQVADEVVVIGQGHLINAGSVDDFVAKSQHNWVRVKSPQIDDLKRLLVGLGATVSADETGALEVRGADAEAIGELAFKSGIELHELATVVASLEDAFLEATAGSTEYRSKSAQQPPSSTESSS
jgi:ABC-2 type transport system ATP-binding protein